MVRFFESNRGATPCLLLILHSLALTVVVFNESRVYAAQLNAILSQKMKLFGVLLNRGYLIRKNREETLSKPLLATA